MRSKTGPRDWTVASAVAGACLLALAGASPALAQEPAAGPTASIPAAEPPVASAPDFETRWMETAGAVAARDDDSDPVRKPQRRNTKEQPAFTILQIGDSHTAADFFTGELRKRLQAAFGNGGAGYLTAGKPHIGVRSSVFRVSQSSGWSTKSLNKATDGRADFWLSGYNTIATETGQTMSFQAEQNVPFDAIEIETMRQPGGGKIDISLDGKVESQYDLAGDTAEPIVIRLVPERTGPAFIKDIKITTTKDGPVNIASVSVYNRRAGLAYNSVGFPGAQVSYLDKFDDRVFAAELHRISPQIVVLAFGTNEAFNDELDFDKYAATYERTVTRIQNILPGAVIVVVSPPDAAQLGGNCKDKDKDKATATCKPRSAEGDQCAWRSLAPLTRIREIQQEIANRHKLVYWNWASIMPEECGAHKWATMSPPLMAKDHVHFTIEGYKKGAAEFLDVLMPIIRELRARSNVVSNN